MREAGPLERNVLDMSLSFSSGVEFTSCQTRKCYTNSLSAAIMPENIANRLSA